jgi:hypothetical protein
MIATMGERVTSGVYAIGSEPRRCVAAVFCRAKSGGDELMTIKLFAEKYRARVKLDSCRDEIIPGKQFCKDLQSLVEYRSHIYEGFNDGRLGICLMFKTARKWTATKKILIAAGFIIKQNGDSEGCATFDPSSEAQARLALRVARVKTIRAATPRVMAALAKARDSRQAALNLASGEQGGGVQAPNSL